MLQTLILVLASFMRGTDRGAMRIRLYGIDTEESRTRDVEEKKFGISQLNLLIQIVLLQSEQ